MLLPMQEKFALPGLVQSLTSPFSGLSKPAQEASAAADAPDSGASAGSHAAPPLHERHGNNSSAEDVQIMLVPGQRLAPLLSKASGQQEGRDRHLPSAAPASDALLSQHIRTLNAPQSPASATQAAQVLAGLVSPEPVHSQPHGKGPSSAALQSSPSLQQHEGQLREPDAEAVLRQQARMLDSPHSPASATHAAHVLAGLVSPEPERGLKADIIGASTTAASTSPHPKEETSPESRSGMQRAVRRSPAGPGQSRLDELLGIALRPESGIAGGQSEDPSHHQPDSASKPAQRPSLDSLACHGGDTSQTAGGGQVQLEPPAIANNKQLSVAEQHERLSGGQHPEDAQSMPENAYPEPLAHLQKAADSSLADPPAGGRPDNPGASPMQPSLSMAAAGSFCNFRIAAGGLAQWRHLVSGKQVCHAGPSKSSL